MEPADVDLLYCWENASEDWWMGATLAPMSREAMRRFVTGDHDFYRDRQLRWMLDVQRDDTWTTVGAIDAVDKTKTFKELAAHFSKAHDITIMGAGHLSMYMGAGAVKSRLVGPADFAGKKIRSMGPAENALLSALGANPQAMAFGDVPPALQTGVIDALLTSLGGFNATKEQAPYFTVAGLNGIVGDYYCCLLYTSDAADD